MTSLYDRVKDDKQYLVLCFTTLSRDILPLSFCDDELTEFINRPVQYLNMYREYMPLRLILC